jgi:superfamily II DNA/RNA helicase
MTFEELNLNPRVFKAISLCGYTEPTTIQSRSIPYILSGKDVVATAQTGTGKTAAFVLPALDRITSSESKGKPRVLILTPTRELATQITDAVTRYGKFSQPSIVSLLGGMPYHKQLKSLSRQVDIIVATPGRLLDHMERGRVDLSCIEMLILDEADRMLDMGFIDDVTAIANQTPKTRQTLMFSATVDGKLSHVVRNLLNEPVRIDLSNEKVTPTKIQQDIYFADNPQHKMRLMTHFLEHGGIYKGIIFTATKVMADRLANELCDLGYEALPLHGDLKQNQRNKTVEQLRRGKVQFVVATDVASRGIDISDITHVINFDLPRFSEDYVHRIGRTGRAGKTGIAISLVLPSDSRHLLNIERYIGQKIASSIVPGLEPTKRPKSYSDSGSGKKRGFGGGSSGRPESRGRDDKFNRGGDRPSRFKSDDRSSSNAGFKRDGDKPSRFKSDDRSSSNAGFKRDGDRPSRFKSDDRSSGNAGFKRDGDRPSRFKSDDRSSSNAGFKRDGDRPSRFKSDDRSSSNAGFKRDGDRPSRFKSDDRSSGNAGFKRDGDRPSSRFKSDDRSSSNAGFKRDGDRPSSRFKSDDRSSSNAGFKRDGDRPSRFKSDDRSSNAGFKRDGGEKTLRFKSGDRATGAAKPASRFKSDSRPSAGNPAAFKTKEKRVSRSTEG